MAKTFGELILECQNYEYSKEHYELTKECYEIELMSKYIESQEFMSENMTEIREEYQNFDESFFIESSSSEDLNAIYEAFDKKSNNVFHKISKFFKSLWKKICNFFNKYIIKSKKNTTTADDVAKLMANIPVDVILAGLGIGTVTNEESAADKEVPKEQVNEQDNKNEESTKEPEEKKDDKKSSEIKKPGNLNKTQIGALRKIVNNAWKDEYTSAGFTIAANQSGINNMENSNSWKKLKKKKDASYVVDMLVAAMNTNSVFINIDEKVKVLPIEAFTAIYEMIANKDSYDDKFVLTIKKKIQSELNRAKKSKIEIKVDPESLDSIKNKLNDINSKMDEFMKESDDGTFDMDAFIFTEASVAQKRREKKAAQKAAGGAKPHENNTVVMSNAITTATDAKNVSVNVTAMKEVYSELVVISGNIMKMLNIIENYRSEACKNIAKWANVVSK